MIYTHYKGILVSIVFIGVFSTVGPVEAYSYNQESFVSVVRNASATGGQSLSGVDGKSGIDGLDGKDGQSGKDGRTVVHASSATSVSIQSSTNGSKTTYVYKDDVSKETVENVSYLTPSSTSPFIEDVQEIVSATQNQSPSLQHNLANLLKALSSIRLILLTYVGI